MNEIKFMHNWNNKLDCQVFTTIRKYTQQKLNYYLDRIGEPFDVILGRKELKCQAILKRVDVKPLQKFPYILLCLDTGKTDPEIIETIFKNFGIKLWDRAILLIFERL